MVLHGLGKNPRGVWRLAKADIASLQAIRVGPYTVFNIKGNVYRLIVKIEYRWQMIFVKHLLTHAEYDRKEWTK
jgi:mRNA interferase HigB